MPTRIHPIRIPFKLPVNAERKADRVVFSYLVLGRQTCLVDAGPVGGESAIIAALKNFGKSPADIDLVINTHEHPDHIGGNSFIDEAALPVFACHTEAVRWIEHLDLQAKERPVYAFHALAGQIGVAVQRKLRDHEVIDLGDDLHLEVLFCPGHSPGSMALFCPEEKTLIAGDVVQPVDGLPLYMDLARTRRSLERLRDFSSVEKLYLAWVEKPYTGAEIGNVFKESLNYLDQVDRITQETVRLLGANAAPEEITREVLMRLNLSPPPVMPITIATIMAHLIS